MLKIIGDIIKTKKLMKLGFHALPRELQLPVWGCASCIAYSDNGTIFLADSGDIRHLSTTLSNKKVSLKITNADNQQVFSATGRKQIYEVSKNLNSPEELFVVSRILSGGDLKPFFMYNLSTSQRRKENKKLVSGNYHLRTNSDVAIKVISDKVPGCFYQISLHDKDRTLATLLIHEINISFKGSAPRHFVAPAELDTL